MLNKSYTLLEYLLLLAFFIIKRGYQLIDWLTSLSLRKKYEQPRVVIIGGGFLGSNIAKYLQNDAEVTLIDNKFYFEFTPSVVNAFIGEAYLRKIQVLHAVYLKRVEIVGGTVCVIRENDVVLETGEIIGFDYLVVATGMDYTVGFDSPRMINTRYGDRVFQSRDLLLDSEDVLIIGGGVTGVEMASVIKDEFPEKNVTLVHSGNMFFENIFRTLKPNEYCRSTLEDQGVNIILGDRVTHATNDTFLTQKGKKLNADIAYLCAGNRPSIPNLELAENSANERGFLNVNEYLQVSSYNHIFAGGDCASIPGETKLAQTAEFHSDIIGKNILRQIRSGYHLGHAQPALKSYSPKDRMVVISLGRFKGIFIWGTWCITGYIGGILKLCVEYKTLVRYWKLSPTCSKPEQNFDME